MIKVKWDNVVVMHPQRRKINLGNYTEYDIVFFNNTFHNILFIGLERKGCFTFNKSDFYHFRYVSEKLGLYEPDAMAIADWMNAQYDNDSPQQGTYQKDLIIIDDPLIALTTLTPIIIEG